MINVKIPAEIRAYKSKLLFGLSVRQLISIIGALAVCVPVGVYWRGRIPDDLLIWLEMLLVVPFAGWGFLTVGDMKFEECIRTVYRFYFTPQKREYEDTETNLFVQLHDAIIEQNIIEQRIESGEYERTEVPD